MSETQAAQAETETTRPFLADCEYSRPSNYLGATFYGTFQVYGMHRDSDVLTRSNFAVMLQRLESLAETFPEPENADDEDGGAWVYTSSAGHFLVGWVEHIYVRQDAPAAILDAADKMLQKLDEYPILDEDHFSELEDSEVMEYWESAGDSERLRMLQYYPPSKYDSVEDFRHLWAIAKGRSHPGAIQRLYEALL